MSYVHWRNSYTFFVHLGIILILVLGFYSGLSGGVRTVYLLSLCAVSLLSSRFSASALVWFYNLLFHLWKKCLRCFSIIFDRNVKYIERFITSLQCFCSIFIKIEQAPTYFSEIVQYQISWESVERFSNCFMRTDGRIYLTLQALAGLRTRPKMSHFDT
jgi:hypothetical protein